MISPAFSYRVEHIGQDQQELLVIDNFVENAQGLINYAMQQRDVLPAGGHYPGLRSPAPIGYQSFINDELSDVLTQVFALQKSQISMVDSYYSLVCTPLEQLSVVQRLPHFDQPKTDELAVIHYLCDAKHGGTSFYRHRSSGFEYINEQRLGSYLASLENEIQRYGMPRKPCYINNENVFFSKVVSVPAKFNRAVIYRCSSLHSGDISPDYKFDLNPMSGRFTIASFIHS